MSSPSTDSLPPSDHSLTSERFLRLAFMLLFWFILCVAGYIMAISIVVLCLFSLFASAPQERLREFAHSLSQYIYQILQFLTYNSERKPFPFADWP